MELDAFRQEVRDWLADNCPPSMRTPVRGEADYCWGGRDFQFQSDDQRVWLARMGAKGWTVPTWPRDYGGGGLNPAEAKILASEMAKIGARPPLHSFGVWMLGPALLKFASEEQKRRFLPPIARGEIRWCQGYSEPGSGSDLASLACKAEDCGDHFRVTGQKVWTSYADQSDWIFCLVRTDTSAPKHQGISFLLFDMASKGVSTRPIRLISGSSPFCESFFDAVDVPKDQLVGDLGQGWTIAKYLLTHERKMIGALGGFQPLGAAAADRRGRDAEGKMADRMLRADVANYEVDALAFAATMARMRDRAKAGGDVGAYASLLKYAGTELNKTRQELSVRAGGMDALCMQDADAPVPAGRDWLRSKANSIEGGTSEIQLNIIAKRLLDLPAA